ncbi:alkaline phosphatase family protein [Nocardioides nanhaiensis]|uniref:Alkaline phosphatase family protein n=1 Tax=Nocardioides nanhaiensis TaxID=1476871 RepID=A0ABP8WUA8_9ACTN
MTATDDDSLERVTGGRATGEISAARRLRILVIALVYSGLWAVLCNVVLELSVWIGEPGPALWKIPVHNKAMYLGAAVIWIVIMLAIAVSNRFWASLGTTLALTVLVAVVNHVKMGVRREPLYPSDVAFLSEPRFLWAMVSPWHVAVILAVMVLIVAAALWTGRRTSRLFPRTRRRESPRWWWGLLVVRGVVAASCLALLVSASHFNQPGNPWRNAYENQGAAWRFWYQILNYRDNGFVGGFLYNTDVPAMSRPPGYSETAMDAIAARYRTAADRINSERDSRVLADTNVIVILSEAFSDPTRLAGFELAEDPIPRTRATMAGTTSGSMLAQLYGGGTANMEFEALTGQSLKLFSPQLNTPYQQLVADHVTYPSAVGWLADTHRRIAVHPYFTGMYKRNKVYDTLGFEEFVHDTTMQRSDKLEDGDFISDQSAFDEVLHQVERSDDPLLVNLVTMQNHVPMSGSYHDPVDVAGVEKDQAQPIGAYARGLSYTDAALADLLDSLESQEERTVVVFYGDHQPGIYGDEIISANPALAPYRTEFFLWDSEGNSPAPQPLTSPIHFLPMAMDMLGAEIPPYYVLLKRLREEIPAMEGEAFYTPDGRPHTDIETLSPTAQQLLEDLQMVQYDFSVGERYALDDMWYSSAD